MNSIGIRNILRASQRNAEPAVIQAGKAGRSAALCRHLLTGLLITAAALAQDSGVITGTVRDSTGAVVPGANITLTSVAQGTAYRTTSNAEGEYLFAALPAGNYNLAVTTTDFKPYQVKDVVLRVAEKTRVDISLQVGDVKEAITVQAEGMAQVETESSDLGGTVTGKEISQTVLNGRNFAQLITLVPGVSNQSGQDEAAVGVYGNVSMSVNGGRTEYNNWEIDGGENMDNGSNTTLNVYPNIDAIAEVKVLTSNYGAQYGRNGSGTVETITKSGTKQFHGDLFEFFRNDDMNARNPFLTENPEYKKNDFGYTLGGPVFIPKVYNASRDKTFFFWSEEWRREVVPGQDFNLNVPSAAERSGNFNDVCPGPDCPINPATGQPYPNNQVPVDPNAQAIVKALIPEANSPGNIFNAAPATPTHWREELIRVDQNFSDKVRLFGRFIHDSWDTVTPTTLWASDPDVSFPNVQTRFVGPGVSGVLHMTTSISPTLLNETTFSYTTDHIDLNAIGDVARPSGMTMTGLFANGFGGVLPAISMCCNNAYNFGGGWGEDPGYFPWNNANPTYTYRDQVAKNSGGHNLFFGFDFTARQKNEMSSGADTEGILTFSTSSAVTTGNAFADLLTGQIASYQQWNTRLKYYNRVKSFEPYFQDDWHVNRRLTLNLGVRVSMFGTYREKYQNAYNFEPGAWSATDAPAIDVDGSVTGQAGALIPGVGSAFDGMVQCGKGGASPGCMKGHLFNPAPRVGLAWDLFGNGRTALRAGYGIFYEETNGNEGNTESLENSPPAILNPTQYNVSGYTNIGGQSLLFPLNPTSIPTAVQWPYVQQWHFDIEQQVARDLVGTVSYVGSKGTHLTLQRDINQLQALPASQNPYQPGQTISSADCASITGAGTSGVSGVVNGQTITGQAAINLATACGNDPNPYRPYTGFGNITALEDGGNSSYNAMQVALRRTGAHFQFNLAYTWSHSIDDSSDRYDTTFLDSYDLARSRATSNFDQRQILNVGYVYDVPSFAHGTLHRIVDGWELSGLIAWQTGTPFSVLNGVTTDNAGVGNGIASGSFVDVIGNPNANVPAGMLYNPAAFAVPTGLTFGNAGRNILTNPSRANVDMGLFKHFPIAEGRYFEFRAEGFNVFNHTELGNLNGVATLTCPTGVDCPGFLVANSAHNARILQLALKFIF